MKGWHFVRKDKKLGYDDGNIVAPGYVYEVEPPLKMCEWGLHASKDILNALQYAPGPICCRVELSGEILHDEDKSVATRREVLWLVDAEETLREFARLCALDVIDKWNAPPVVVEYLKTGKESLREDTYRAALAVARAAAWSAGSAAVRAAVSAAAAAESAAAAAAAESAVRWAAAAAESAVRWAAEAAVRAAESAAAGVGVRWAASAAAAAESAAAGVQSAELRKKQSARLEKMVRALGRDE